MNIRSGLRKLTSGDSFQRILIPVIVPLFFLLLLALVYQLPAKYTVNLGQEADSWAIGQGFGARESNANFSFRWTVSDKALLNLPDIGSSTRITVVGLAPRPDNKAPEASLTSSKTITFTFEPAASSKPPTPDGRLTLEIDGFKPALHLFPNRLEIRSELFHPQGDFRNLGLVLNQVTIEKTAGLSLPPLTEWLGWTLAFSLLYFLLKAVLKIYSGKRTDSFIALGITTAFLILLLIIRLVYPDWYFQNGVSLSWGIALPLAVFLIPGKWLRAGLTLVLAVSGLILARYDLAGFSFFLTLFAAGLVLNVVTNYSFRNSPKPDQSTGIKVLIAHSLRYLVIAGIFLIALNIRLHAANTLDTDFDEPTYLRAARLYAQHLANGDLVGIVNEQENYEHPVMSKLIFGSIMLWNNDYTTVVQRTGANQRGINQRIFNATVASITAGVVALENPLAGFLVAVNGWNIQYTSEVYLEAVAGFFAAMTLLLLYRSKRNGDWPWWLAAVMLGLTGANKYIYAVGGIAALIWMFWRDKQSWRKILLWPGVSLLVFYLTNPVLWFDPLGRLRQSLGFSVNYTGTGSVTKYDYQWYQPAIWLFSEPDTPTNHLHTFPLPVEGLVTVICLLALPFLWKRSRLLFIWIAVNFFFLLIWPTKWNQYVLILTVPMALAAAIFLGYLGLLLWKRTGWSLPDKIKPSNF